MSAIVCRKRFFNERASSPTPVPNPAPVYKRIRRYSLPSPIDQIRTNFPDIEEKLLEEALHDNGKDIESAIESLHKLCLVYTHENSGPVADEPTATSHKGVTGINTNDDNALPTGNSSSQENPSLNGSERVELLMQEMTSATSIDDAKSRARKLLEGWEKSMTEHAKSEVGRTSSLLHKENMILKEQNEGLRKENTFWKRAFVVMHRRMKENEERTREVDRLRQLVSQYREQLQTLEVNNYALKLQLQRSATSDPIPGCFHRDVF